MQVKIENLKDSQVKVTVELTAEEMKPYEKQAVEELQTQVKADGFREGNIPLDIIKQKVGEQAFTSAILDFAISQSYEDAVKQEKVRPVDYPKINVVQQNPLKYEATVPVVPETKWKKDVAKLTLKSMELKVEDSEIDEVLNNLKTRSTKWTDVDRAAKIGDRVEIDFDGFDKEGKALEGTSSKNHPVVLGEGGLIPGFEEEIKGMKKNEEKDFNITFPKDYHAEEFKSKKVKFHIKLNRVEESEEAELSDDFAKEITGGNRQNMKELKEEIVEELLKQKDRQEQARLENKFLKALVPYVDVKIPDALVEREIDFMIDRMKQDLERRKQTWEDYEKEMKEKGKDIRAELKDPAKEQVLIRLALEKLEDEDPMKVTDEEVEKEVEIVLAYYPPQVAPMMKDRYKEGSKEREMLRAQLRLSKRVAKHTK